MKYFWRLIYKALYLFSLPLIAYAERTKHYAYMPLPQWLYAKLGYAINTLPIPTVPHKTICFHAVSMGEVNAAISIIKKWLVEFPQDRIIISTHTITGHNAATKLINMAEYKDNCQIVIPPFDISSAVNNFFNTYKINTLILLESDLWPAISWTCKKKHIPLFIVNARVSPKSMALIHWLTKLGIDNLFSPPQAIIAQNQEMADNWQWLKTKVFIGGQIKYDVELPTGSTELGDTFSNYLKKTTGKKVLLFASTRAGEEEISLKIWEKLHIDIRDKLILAIVPRHPERIREVSRLISTHNLTAQNRSSIEKEDYINNAVWLGDSVGEMFAYYTLADIAVIGGGLLSYGSQNPIEAFIVGVPTILGAHSYNFSMVREDALAHNATLAITNTDVDETITQACELISTLINNEKLMSEMCINQQNLINANKGAIVKTINILKKELH